MSVIQDWWNKLAKQARDKGIKRTADDVESIWRIVSNELEKEGIKPTDPKFNPELMLRTKARALKESNFDKYLKEEREKDKRTLDDKKCPKCGKSPIFLYKKQNMYECNNCRYAWQKKD